MVFVSQNDNFVNSITLSVQGGKVFDFVSLVFREANDEVDAFTFTPNGNAAKKAAIENGWCSNDFEAKNSLLNSLEAITGQKEQWQPSKQNEVFHHFYDKHMKRKGELKEAA